MIEGVLRHDTEMTVKKNFVDTHGQSEVAFAFCHLLGFELMPRLKGIHRQKLYRPLLGDKSTYPNLQSILTRPINWELIRQQYDQMIKYTTALQLGTADPEAILRRFTRANVKHPTYQALGELGKVLKSLSLPPRRVRNLCPLRGQKTTVCPYVRGNATLLPSRLENSECAGHGDY